ncbi:MAG: HlyD family type I secretion periplasmic adaptor subunit [Caulobacteraceae bacterium]
MKLDFKPFTAVAELPAGVAEQYRRYMGEDAPKGELDDARGVVRTGLIVFGAIFAAFILIAGLAPINGAAIAPGLVIVAGERQAVQATSDGVVAQMLVREGQAVRGGQVLARLNGVASGARLLQTYAQRDAQLAARARLVAERDGAEAIAWPADLAARRGDPVAAEAMENQEALFTQRKRVWAAESGIAEAKLREAKANQVGAARQLDLIRSELSGIASLYRRGFAPRSRLLALQRAEADLQTEVSNGGSAVAEAELTLEQTRQTRLNKVLEELRDVQARLAQSQPQLTVSQYDAERDVLRAPLAGRAVGVVNLGPGSVVATGQKILEILPDGRGLIVHARVKPQDIDDVRIGQAATVRLTTINPRGRSSFDGKVTTISADRLTDPRTGEGYYLALIALDEAELSAAGIRLQPGVPAVVNIKTHARTLLEYLLYPITDALSGGFREE